MAQGGGAISTNQPEAFLAELLGEFHLCEEPPLRLRLVHGRAADYPFAQALT